MRKSLVLSLILISISVFGQDTAKKKIDSSFYYPDTMQIKVPGVLIEAFVSLINQDEEGVTLKKYKEVMILVSDQIRKQLVKKPDNGRKH